MIKILRDIFTGPDNVTHDMGIYLWGLSVLAGLAYSGYDLVVLHTPFNIINFGVGVSSLLAAGAGALFLKKDVTPK